MTATRRVAAAATGIFLSGSLAASVYWRYSTHISENQKNIHHYNSNDNNNFFYWPSSKVINMEIPTDPRGRFHYYAKRGPDGSEVLDPLGFVACICLLDNESRKHLVNDKQNQLSPHVRKCLEHLFGLMDIHHDKGITYDEFCILLTLLSTRRKNMQLAFGVFDKNEDNSLSKHEFRHMLNALMIDPKVQIVKRRPSLLSQKLEKQKQNEIQEVESEKLNSSQTTELDNINSTAMSTSTMTKDELLSSPLAKRFFGPNGDNRISFNEFWSMIREIRWVVREIEFGLYDPRNTGQITLKDFRRIMTRSGNKNTDYNNSNSSISSNNENEEFLSWDFFLKVFDVLYEYDTVGHAMDLALRARPPIEKISSSVSGLITTIKDNSDLKETTTTTTITTTTLENISSPNMSYKWELDSSEFYRVLQSCHGFSHLTQEDVDRIVRIFDLDGSGKLSPDEFARMCQMRTSFFTPRQPRFNEPRRNVIQQFVFCMQQLK